MSKSDKHTFLAFVERLIILIIFSIALVACSNGVKIEQINQTTKDTINVVDPTFVGSTTCVSCHKEEFKAWDGSHHQQAMKMADSSSVLGDFNNVKFKKDGVTTTFFKKSEEFWVNTEDSKGTYQDYKVVYTFGVFPLQQYLIEFPNGAYQCLLTAWDAKAKKWYDLQPKLKIHHDEWMNWSEGSMTWNTMCADCHSTNLHKNYDNQTSTYKTTFSEINVSCESCHGPSSSHVSFYENPRSNIAQPKLRMTKGLSSQELVAECARCHSRRAALTKYYDFKGDFLDHYNPALLTAPNYEIDGQIKEEDYVYSSFIQSKMYHNGVSCKDCHNPHTLELKKKGNDLCLSCHELKYNSSNHHFHKEKTSGSQCVNCHMTGQTYMGTDFRRDHSFRIPRPDQSIEYGTPNACTKCHDKQSDEWANTVIKKNYGETRPDHFSTHLLAGLNGDKVALKHLISHSQYPSIARATGLSYYSSFQLTNDEIYQVIDFLQDSSALVRNEAVKTLEAISANSFTQYLEPLLMDSIRLVRISVSRSLNKQTSEYLEELDMNSDFASGQYHIAANHQKNGRNDLAIKAYEKSILIDNYFNASRMNLALLLYKEGNINKAEKLYLKVIEQEPAFGESYYMLGLLFNERNDRKKALEYLQKACKKQTTNYKPFYNYALMLQAAGSVNESINIVEKGLVKYPSNEQLLYVKLTTELNMKNYTNAKSTLARLLIIAPSNADYQRLSNQLNH